MTKPMAVALAQPRLASILGDQPAKEFWLVVESWLPPDPLGWPRDVVEALILEEELWKSQQPTKIEPLARTYACARAAGHCWCVVRVVYAHVRRKESVSPSAQVGEAGGSAGITPPSASPARQIPHQQAEGAA